MRCDAVSGRSLGEYEACKRKFLSLQRTVEDSVVSQAERDLRHAKNTYDADRFGLARSLLSIHHTKKSFFVETTSEVVDAHMKFFKQGFDLIRVMEPYIHESLDQVQASPAATRFATLSPSPPFCERS